MGKLIISVSSKWINWLINSVEHFKCSCLIKLICLKQLPLCCLMMTSSNGNIFRVTGHLCGEFAGHRWIPRAKASDAELWCFFYLRLNKRLSKQWWGWWCRRHRAHYDVTEIYGRHIVSIRDNDNTDSYTRQAITWTIADLFSLGTQFSEIWIATQQFSIKTKHLKKAVYKISAILCSPQYVKLYENLCYRRGSKNVS